MIHVCLHINLFPNKPWFLHVCSTSLPKTRCEKDKLLVTSNFSFSHCVFYLFGGLSVIFNKFEILVCRLFQFGRVLNLSFGERLIRDSLSYKEQYIGNRFRPGLSRLTWAGAFCYYWYTIFLQIKGRYTLLHDSFCF